MLIVFKLMTLISLIATLGLVGGLAYMGQQSGFLTEDIQLSKEVILSYHGGAVAAIAFMIYGFIQKLLSRALLGGAIIVAITAEGSFTLMNIQGFVSEIPQAEELIESAKDEALDRAKSLMD